MKCYIHCILFLFLWVVVPAVSAQNEEDVRFDSLLHVAENAKSDTTKLRIYEYLASRHYNVDSAFRYSNLTVDYAHKLGDKKHEARGENLLYWCYYHYNEYMKATEHAFSAIVLAQSVGDTVNIARGYHNLGVVYASRFQNATLADEYYHKAFELYALSQDSAYMCDVLRDIANCNYMYEMFDESIECYKRAMEIDSCRNNITGVSENMMGLAAAYYAQYESVLEADTKLLAKSKAEYLKALAIAKSVNYDYTEYIVYSELPNVLLSEASLSSPKSKAILDSCETFVRRGYEMADLCGYGSDRFELDYSNIILKTYQHKFTEAKTLADSLEALMSAQPERYSDQFFKLCRVIRLYYEELGDYKMAMKYFVKYFYYYNQSRKKDYAIQATQSMAQSKFDEQMRVQKQQEMALENEVRMHAIISYASVLVVVITLLLSVVIVRLFLRSRKLVCELDVKNSELQQHQEEMLVQNELLEEKNKIITSKNKQITDSINYASVIQQAAMPSEKVLDNIFGSHLTIFHPLNIVSGDFYWATQTDKYRILAVADCTGHGVPGAFLSMLGMSILDYLAASADNKPVFTAASMLDDMRHLFKQSLHQRGEDADNHDGIDMSLVVMPIGENSITYAGAFRPLLVVHDGKVSKYDADRMPIGTHYNEQDHFTNHIIQLAQGDSLYMYSDGVTDQFGYDENNQVHKLTFKRLRSVLESVSSLPFGEQRKIIEESIASWRTPRGLNSSELYEQTDDVVLVGIRL